MQLENYFKENAVGKKKTGMKKLAYGKEPDIQKKLAGVQQYLTQ